jgi:hypothetical protein
MSDNYADIVLLEGGRNDFNNEVPLGDVDTHDTKTFSGALNVTIEGLKAKYPDAMIVCISNWNFPGTKNELGCADYANAMEAVAQKQGRHVHLKVILETGLLRTPEAIANASFLAMEAGADFIKTSTGKVDVNATPVAAYVMCECIARYHEMTGKKIGFKPAGGISSAADALCYYSIVSTVLGKEWLNKSLFRFGVSRVANSILSAVEQKTVTYF